MSMFLKFDCRGLAEYLPRLNVLHTNPVILRMGSDKTYADNLVDVVDPDDKSILVP